MTATAASFCKKICLHTRVSSNRSLHCVASQSTSYKKNKPPGRMRLGGFQCSSLTSDRSSVVVDIRFPDLGISTPRAEQLSHRDPGHQRQQPKDHQRDRQ